MYGTHIPFPSLISLDESIICILRRETTARLLVFRPTTAHFTPYQIDRLSRLTSVFLSASLLDATDDGIIDNPTQCSLCRRNPVCDCTKNVSRSGKVNDE